MSMCPFMPVSVSTVCRGLPHFSRRFSRSVPVQLGTCGHGRLFVSPTAVDVVCCGCSSAVRWWLILLIYDAILEARPLVQRVLHCKLGARGRRAATPEQPSRLQDEVMAKNGDLRMDQKRSRIVDGDAGSSIPVWLGVEPIGTEELETGSTNRTRTMRRKRETTRTNGMKLTTPPQPKISPPGRRLGRTGDYVSVGLATGNHVQHSSTRARPHSTRRSIPDEAGR